MGKKILFILITILLISFTYAIQERENLLETFGTESFNYTNTDLSIVNKSDYTGAFSKEITLDLGKYYIGLFAISPTERVALNHYWLDYPTNQIVSTDVNRFIMLQKFLSNEERFLIDNESSIEVLYNTTPNAINNQIGFLFVDNNDNCYLITNDGYSTIVRDEYCGGVYNTCEMNIVGNAGEPEILQLNFSNCGFNEFTPKQYFVYSSRISDSIDNPDLTFIDYFKFNNVLTGNNELPNFNITIDNEFLCVDEIGDYATFNFTIDDLDLENDTILYSFLDTEEYNYDLYVSYTEQFCTFGICSPDTSYDFLEYTRLDFDMCEFQTNTIINSSKHNLVYIDELYYLMLNGACENSNKEYLFDLQESITNINYETEIKGISNPNEEGIFSLYNVFDEVLLSIKMSVDSVGENATMSQYNGTTYTKIGSFPVEEVFSFRLNGFPTNLENSSFTFINHNISFPTNFLTGNYEIIVLNESIFINYGIEEYFSFSETTGNTYDQHNEHFFESQNGVNQESIGIVGNGYHYDGIDDYLNTSNYDFSNNKSVLSVSVWIYPDTLNKGQIISITDGISTDERFYLKIRNDQKIVVGGVSIDGGIEKELRTNLPYIIPSEWNHITGVVNYENDTIRIYHNGEFKEEMTSVGFINPTTASTNSKYVNIGAKDNGINNLFTGNIDELILFDINLNDEIVSNIYNNTLTGYEELETIEYLFTPYENNAIRYIGIDTKTGTTFYQKYFHIVGIYPEKEFTTSIPTNFTTNKLGYSQFDIYITDDINVGVEKYSTASLNFNLGAGEFCFETSQVIDDNGFEFESELTGIPLLISKLIWFIRIPYYLMDMFGFSWIAGIIGVFISIFAVSELFFKGIVSDLKHAFYILFALSTLLMFMKFFVTPVYIGIVIITGVLIGSEFLGNNQ